MNNAENADYTYVEGEIVTPQQRIAELENEVRSLGGRQALSNLIQNPGALSGLLKLSPEQAVNVKAIIAGAGAAASHKYLSKHIGDEFSAIMGAAVAVYLAKRVFGSSK